MGVASYKFVRWQRRIFLVTNLNVKLFDDFLEDEHANMPIAAVTGSKRKTPFLYNLLSWLRITNLAIGTFVLETASQEEAINKVGYLAGATVYEQIIQSLAQGQNPFVEPDGTWS